MSSAVRRGLRGALAKPNTKVILGGVPTYATSGDVRRAILQADIKGCSEVSLIYEHAKPTGNALLGLTTPEYGQEARKEAREISMFGSKLSAEYATRDESKTSAPGYGPNASVGPQMAVLITGYELAKEGDQMIAIQTQDQPFRLHSRILVRLASRSEAHRLVRAIHMTPYGDSPLPIRAEIIY